MRLPLLALAVLTLSGCSAFGLGGDLAVEARSPELLLTNETGRTVSFVAFESSIGPYIDLAPVGDWPTLAAGETLSIPYESLDGYDEGDEAATLFWSVGARWEQKSVRL